VWNDERFYRRRAAEELAAAERSVTQAARLRHIQLAEVFLGRLERSDECPSLQRPEEHAMTEGLRMQHAF
jgi:hypothetical protein